MLYAASRMADVVVREMRSSARGKGIFVLRTVFGAIIAAGALELLTSAEALRPGLRMAAKAEEMFRVLVWVQGLAAVVLGVALGIQTMRAERRDRTLGLLVLSSLQPVDVIRGKLFALLALLMLVFLAPMPVCGLMGWMGGLDYRWLGMLALLCACLAAFGLALGMAATLVLRSAVRAVLACGLLLAAGAWWLPSVAAPPSFIDAVARQGPSFGSPFLGMALHVAATALLVGLAARALPRATAPPQAGGLRPLFEKLDAFFRAINVGGVVLTRSGVRRRPQGNPVYWLAVTSGGMSQPQYQVRLAAGTFLLPFLGLSYAWHEEIGAGIAVLAGLVPVVAGLWLGAGAVAGEREHKSLRLLLVTPLAGRRILAGRTLAAARMLALLALPPLAATLLLASLVEGEFSWEVLPWALLYLAEVACGFAMAMACSLYFRTPLRAALAGLLALVGTQVMFFMAMGATNAALMRGTTMPVTLFAILLGVVAVSLPVGVWARRHGRPGIELVAMLGFCVLGAGMVAGVPWGHTTLLQKALDPLTVLLDHGWSPFVEAEMAAGFAALMLLAVGLFHYTARTFDRALGRAS